MEKYCKNCGRVFDDLNYKLCPFCGSELDTRYGRQPIPRKLRHEVFKRDGYRCRECGASKDETSLEIDHIVPVAKGGTNDIDNLQTLCRECNRMKHTDEWVGGESDIESTKNELKLLKEQLIKLENALDSPTTEEERIDLKYKIIKLNEAIEKVQIRLDKLIIKQKQLEKELEEYRRKKSLFKRLYVELTDEELDLISFHLLLAYSSKEKYAIKEELVRYLVNHYSHSEILDLIDKEREISRSQEFYYINRYRIEIIYCAYSQYKNFGISFFKIDWENQTISFPWNEETQTLTFNEIYDDLGILEDPLPHLTFLDKILLKEEWDSKFNNDFSNKQIDPLTFEEFGFFYNHYRYSKFNSRFESSDIGFLDYETLKRSYDENELITIYDYDIEDKKDIFCIEIRSKELYYLIKFNIDWEAIKREEEERKKREEEERKRKEALKKRIEEEKAHKRQVLFEKLDNGLDDDLYQFIIKKFNIEMDDREDVINYLIDHYSEDEIYDDEVRTYIFKLRTEKAKVSNLKMKECPKCNHKINEKASKCPYCGYQIANVFKEDKKEKTCPICNQNQDIENKFCISCKYDFENKRVNKGYFKKADEEKKKKKGLISKISPFHN